MLKLSYVVLVHSIVASVAIELATCLESSRASHKLCDSPSFS